MTKAISVYDQNSLAITPLEKEPAAHLAAVGDFATKQLIELEESSEDAWRNTHNAASLPEALNAMDQIGVHDFFYRLNAALSTLARFSDELSVNKSSQNVREHLQATVKENALDLAGKTLLKETIDKLPEQPNLPPDDVGFSHPPTMSEAFEVIMAYDATKDETIYEAALAMLRQCTTDGHGVDESIAILIEVHASGKSFRSVFNSEWNSSIKDAAYFARRAAATEETQFMPVTPKDEGRYDDLLYR